MALEVVMSKEREMIEKLCSFQMTYSDWLLLIADAEELLAQPEQEPVAWIIETEVEGKLLEWVCTDKKHYIEEHDSIKEPIPLYLAPPKQPESTAEAVMPNGVCVSNVYDAYEEGRKSVMVEQEPVAWKVIDGTNGKYMFSRIKPTERSYKYDVVIPLYLAPPTREPLGLEIMDVCGSEDYREGFKDGALYAEKCHGIGGGE
jgi:hypothetical protein